MIPRVLVALSLVAILGVPLLLREDQGHAIDEDAPTLIVITPHVEQITDEFERAFDRWHRRVHGSPVRLDVRRPGGTSEIIRQLRAQFDAAVRNEAVIEESTVEDGRVRLAPGTISFDVMFGGGSYDHGRLVTAGPTMEIGGDSVPVPMSTPAGFEQAELDAWLGENLIGAEPIYDPAQHWIGVACSSFGIVFNRDVYARLGIDEPTTFADLTNPALAGWIALADPRQSGSITTTFDSILNNEATPDPETGEWSWDEGWRILRAMSANTRYFTNSSTKPPIDVSQGEAAAGLAIDFYGRSQAQSVMRPGETPATARVGYEDPAGAVFIDPDPISILNGAPHPELAKRFLAFSLSDEGQALWQFPPLRLADGSVNPVAANNPVGPDGSPMGPEFYALRRLPIRRSFIDTYRSHFVDNVDPFEIASDVESRGWRSAIGMMMGAFGIDTGEECREAWRALHGEGTDPARFREAREVFFAFPTGEQVRATWTRLFPDDDPPEDACQDFTPETYRDVRDTWRDADVQARLEIVYAEIFEDNYERVVRIMKCD